MANEPTSEGLSILTDEPLFREGSAFDSQQDAFNHEAYAKAIYQIVSENDPPVSIGLFGPWGIGKSTVVNILFHLIRQHSPQKLKPIYFNAWKYSGDSFRRQFLIEVAKYVYEGSKDKEAKIRRLEQLNYTDVLRETEAKSIKEQIQDLLKKEVRFRAPGLARVLIALVVLLVGATISLLVSSVYPFLATLLPALLVFILKMKFEDLLIIQENPVYDPKLIFPEQFEEEFGKLVASGGPLGGAKAVIAIDDIDRCEPPIIRDILVSIKSFIGHKNCFFVVPCDDKSIVQVFQDPNQQQGYRDELLRKYFNVGVRIVPLMGTDLVDLANSVSKETNIPQSVAQIAILANYRDARKMKHFLNSFAVKLAIAKTRKESGFIPIDIDKNLAGFAKAVLIEDLYPDIFAKMVERPESYDLIEAAALDPKREPELNNIGVQMQPGLRDILRKTREVKIEHIEVFLSLKTTNPEAKIPRGFELKNAILEAEEEVISEIVKGISSEDARHNLATLLKDLLDHTTAIFRKNVVTASLRFYSTEGLLHEDDKQQVAHDATFALLYDGQQTALSQNAHQALECAEAVGDQYCQELVGKFVNEFAAAEQLPANTAETISALHEFANDFDTAARVLNQKLEGWAVSEKGLSALAAIKLPDDVAEAAKVPSLAVLEKIAGALSPENTETMVALNVGRKHVLFKYWRKEVATPFAERLLQIFQQGQSDAGYTPRIKFAVGTIFELPGSIEEKFGPQLWTQVQQVYNRVGGADKFDVHKTVLTFATKAPDGATRSAAANFAKQNWTTFDKSMLAIVLAHLETLEEPARAELKKSLAQQELGTAQSEMPNPTARTRERIELCFEYRSLLDAPGLEGFLVRTLDTQDAAFSEWKAVITEYADKFGAAFCEQIADRCLALVSSYTGPRRQGVLDLFSRMLPHCPATSKSRLLQTYFALLKNIDANIRTAATTVITPIGAAVEPQDFRISLNNLVRSLCDLPLPELHNHQPVFDAALSQSELFDEDSWRDLAALSKRLLQEADSNLQGYGMSIISKMTNIPKEHEEDVIRLLLTLARNQGSGHRQGAIDQLNRLYQTELGETAHNEIQAYLEEVKPQ